MRITGRFEGKDGKERLTVRDGFYNEYTFVIDPEGDVLLGHGNVNPLEYYELDIEMLEKPEWNVVYGEIEIEKREDGTFKVYSKQTYWPYSKYQIAAGYIGYWED